MDTSDLITALEKARALIADGWAEPNSLDAAGKLCAYDAEGLSRVCVADALLLAVGIGGSVIDVEVMLEAALRARGIDAVLSRWLESPKRQHAEVLRLFERTIAHLRASL